MITFAYITAREQPRIEWFLDSLNAQLNEPARILLIDGRHDERDGAFISRLFNHPLGGAVVRHPVKPNIWQGKHRLVSEDWWAVSAATNTAICLCDTDWICCVDDRSILMPGWLDRLKLAMKGGYAVCGSYEKVHNLVVDNGAATAFTVPVDGEGRPNGKDSRLPRYTEEAGKYGVTGACLCPGEWFFGCNFALPVEWALTVNGLPEVADGMGFQDSLFGLILKNNGYPVCYDPSMKILEDRTPSELGAGMRREDKGVSPNDKSHALLSLLRDSKTSLNTYSLRELRARVLAGEPFPVPESKPYFDWYDSETIDANYMAKKQAEYPPTTSNI